VDDFGTLKYIGDQVYKETGSTLDSRTIIKVQLYLQAKQLFDFNILIFNSNDLVATINMVCSCWFLF
jgi:lipoprotein-releasing system permease protein